MMDTHVWGCLVVILCVSCIKVNASSFMSILCITVLLLTLVTDDVYPRPLYVAAPGSDNSEEVSENGPSQSVSARVGEMVPNPRLVKSNKEDETGEEGDTIFLDKPYGQAAFRHMLRMKRDSHVALSKAKLKDAINTGFRP